MKILTALCFVVGVILAGSDGSYFPYINLVGVGLFSFCPVLMWRADKLEKNRIVEECKNGRR